MSQEESTTQQRRAKPKARPVEESFDVGKYMLDMVELGHDRLALDIDLKHGQIRKVNMTHRDHLVEQFTTNAPASLLELTTVLDQSVHPLCFPTCAWWLVSCACCLPFHDRQGKCRVPPLLLSPSSW